MSVFEQSKNERSNRLSQLHKVASKKFAQPVFVFKFRKKILHFQQKTFFSKKKLFSHFHWRNVLEMRLTQKMFFLFFLGTKKMLKFCEKIIFFTCTKLQMFLQKLQNCFLSKKKRNVFVEKHNFWVIPISNWFLHESLKKCFSKTKCFFLLKLQNILSRFVQKQVLQTL